jgi:acetaldehyde dehydrogenase
MVDLTPAAAGPYVVPVVNMGAHFDSPDISMVSCGGQATIPIVAAVSRVATVHYAEIVSSIASKSAGPGTRANIDEFTQTTAHAIEKVGGARRGKAIIVLNPAEPPIMMRNTIFCLSDEADTAEIARSIERTVDEVQDYVGGYRLKQEVQFDRIGADNAMILHGVGVFTGIKTSVFLEVEGSAHYLPSYAGNLDIMTSAALSTAERLAERNWN